MQEFVFSAPAQAQMFNYAVIGLVAVACIVGIAFSHNKAKRIMTAVIMIPVLYFMTRMLLPSAVGMKVTLGETLTVTSSYGKIDIAKGDVVSAAVVDMKADAGFRPAMRTNGTAIGDYKLGWFRLASGKKAFIMAAASQVVAIEVQDKYVMVAPEDFDGFVRALNDGFVPVK